MSEAPRSASTLPPDLAQRIDEVCNRFEATWRRGGSPRLEPFLAGWEGPERLLLLRELAAVEADFRRAAGEEVRTEVYLARFPDFDLSWLDVDVLPPTARPQPPAGPS